MNVIYPLSIVANLVSFFLLGWLATRIFLKVRKNHFSNNVWRTILLVLGAFIMTNAAVHLGEAFHATVHMTGTDPGMYHCFVLIPVILEAIINTTMVFLLKKSELEFDALTHIQHENG